MDKISLEDIELQLVALGAAMISYQRDNPDKGYGNRTHEIAKELRKYHADALTYLRDIMPTENSDS